MLLLNKNKKETREMIFTTVLTEMKKIHSNLKKLNNTFLVSQYINKVSEINKTKK